MPNGPQKLILINAGRYDYAEVELATGNRPRDGRDEVGIVDRLGAECAEVAVLDAQLVEERAQLTLELEARMIGADGDAHCVECKAPQRCWEREHVDISVSHALESQLLRGAAL